MIRIGAIALLGINLITGIKNADSINSKPVVTAVNPVRPPAAILAVLSTVATVGLVPKYLTIMQKPKLPEKHA